MQPAGMCKKGIKVVKVKLPSMVSPQRGTMFLTGDGPQASYLLGSVACNELEGASKRLAMQLAEHPAIRPYLESYGARIIRDADGFLRFTVTSMGKWADLTIAIYTDKELRPLFDSLGLSVQIIPTGREGMSDDRA